MRCTFRTKQGRLPPFTACPYNPQPMVPFVDQPNPIASWLLAGTAVVIVGVAKSGFGGGVGVIATPLFIFAFGDPQLAVGALLPLLIIADIFSVCHHWRKWDAANLRRLLGGSLIGIAAGAGLIWWLGELSESGESWMKFAIGVICVLYVVGDFIKARFAPNWHLRSTMTTGSAFGSAAGLTSTLAHAAGPVITIFLIGQRITKQAFIGTAVIYFFIINLVKLVPYFSLGLIDTSTLAYGLWLVPLVPVGTFAGSRLNRLMTEQAFKTTIMVIVLISGIDLMLGRSMLLRVLGM